MLAVVLDLASCKKKGVQHIETDMAMMTNYNIQVYCAGM